MLTLNSELNSHLQSRDLASAIYTDKECWGLLMLICYLK